MIKGLIVLLILVAMWAWIRVCNDSKEVLEGYNCCKMNYSMNKKVIPYEDPQSPFEEGWNKAIIELMRKELI